MAPSIQVRFCDTANIDHQQGVQQAVRQRLMVHRCERRALAAGGYVGKAEIAGDRQVKAPGQQRRVADLHRSAVDWVVQDRLAVKADQRCGLVQCADCGGVVFGQCMDQLRRCGSGAAGYGRVQLAAEPDRKRQGQ